MTIKLSSLIKGQLPEFINNQYSSFASFLEKYYEGLEVHGQPLDILSNITSYYDINYYQKNLLERGSRLTQSVNLTDTTFELEDASGFPDEYGYFKVDDEICFYTEKDGNTLTGVYRGVSGTTRLGDLYKSSTYTSSDSANHSAGATVQNISNLFLFAIVKSFESQYLSSIPKSYLSDTIDKRTLIKNITDFYKSKGSEKSIKFIFNSLVDSNPSNAATITRPSEQTLKSSESDWISNYEIYINVISGNSNNLVGEKIEQFNPYASAIVDSIVEFQDSTKLIVDKRALNSEFAIYGYTELTNPIVPTNGEVFIIDVVSTKAWNNSNKFIYIGNEIFEIVDRNINQFYIIKRSGNNSYPVGTKLYDRPPLEVNGVKFHVTGSVYNLKPQNKIPYASIGEPILESPSAISSRNVTVYDVNSGQYRWITNQTNQRPTVSTNAAIQEDLKYVNANVSAIFEDETYFYICSSGYPSFDILSATDPNGLENNKYLKLVRKTPVSNTETYNIGKDDVGILLDGTLIYSKISNNSVKYGPIEKVNINSKGSGYKVPPVVLINNSPVKAKAILSGEVVSDIEILTNQTYRRTPSVTITSGRNGKIEALVTSGRITDMVITDPGEYYTSPPIIVITDKLGKGRFASYKTTISSKGKITGVIKIDEGRNYTQENVLVSVIPVGNGANASVEIKKWFKNRFNEYTNIDANSGIVADKKFKLNVSLGKTYAVIANPKKLRYSLNDNINAILNETPSGEHSKIIGFAYDGNPIYGPYAYEDPSNPQSSVVRMLSGYQLNATRENGPTISQYPLGSFDEDFTWVPNVNTGKTYLDKNNGRFCVTPDYPDGVYAYFVTIDASGDSVYPYILGQNYYSIPVDSNYNSPITQDQVPRSAKLVDSSKFLKNGSGFSAIVSDVQQGSVSGFIVDTVTREHNPGNKLVILDPNDSGSGLEASVGEVSGLNVDYLRAKKSVSVLLSNEEAYLFKNFVLRQQGTGYQGDIVNDVNFNNTIILENLTGEFDSTNLFDLIDPDTNLEVEVSNLLLTDSSSFTIGSTINLTDGFVSVASGIILESTSRQNTLRIKVISGDFSVGVDNEDLVLQSSTLSDDVGVGISSIRSLSKNIKVNIIDYNYAILKTSNPHGLLLNDNINIEINPDDLLTEKTYYVRKRLFQEVTFRDQTLFSKLDDTGIGRISILAGGLYDTPGTFPANIGNATVNVTITQYVDDDNNTYNSLSSVEIVDKGSGFVEDDIVQIENLVGSIQQRPAVLRVDHSGMGSDDTTIKLTSVENVTTDDLLKIDNEILKVITVNAATKLVTVERAQEGTSAEEHFDGASINFYNFVYRFNEGDYIPELGTGAFSPTVYSYDQESNKMILSYPYNVNPASISDITRNTFIKDSSGPDRKTVLISFVEQKKFKLEFSEDNELNFIINPNIDVQLYYKYKFDTSHPSMLQTYLDFSPSVNYNLFTTEKIVGVSEPGTEQSDCFVSLKFGFGPAISSNQYNKFEPIRFTNYYYFIVASGVDTENSRISIVQDPLTGTKKVNYSTEDKIVFKIDNQPQENGSGEIKYLTNSSNARGLITSISLDNSGSGYYRIPSVIGVEVPSGDEAVLNPILSSNGEVNTVTVIFGGSGYIEPKIITIGGDGVPGDYRAVVNQGKVVSVNTIRSGKGYTSPPIFKIIESSHKIYPSSKTIGVAKSVSIINSGKAYSKDTTTLPKYTSTLVVLLSNLTESKFSKNSVVSQTNSSGDIIFTGRVVETVREGTNIVKFKDVVGQLDESLPILDATIVSILFTNYEAEFKSFFDKKGYFNSGKGLVSSADSKITDSYYYQDYSYVIRSYTPIDIWRDLIKDVVHPAGFQLFGEVIVEAELKSVSVPDQKYSIPFTTQFNVGIQGGFSETSKIQLTEVVNSLGDYNVLRGVGRFNLDSENLASTNLYDIKLTPEFDGYIDADTGLIFGTKTFTLRDADTNAAITPYNEYAMIISLDGIVQEPGVAFTVSGNQITFATAPLGSRVSEGQTLDASDFVGKMFDFVDITQSEKSFRKISSIFQRSGIWLDSANQIRFNRGFIIEETFGYITTKYPATLFDTEKCKRDIGFIVDAFEHDLRFGGNEKIVVSGNAYYNAANELDFINDELTETREAYLYAAKLCAAAIRNWDVVFIDDPATADPNFEVIVTAGSDLITVPSTFGLVEGMYLSSGEQFPTDTRIIEIIDENNVRVDNNAFTDIVDGTAFIFQVPSNTIEELPGTSGEIEFEYNGIQINTDAQLIIDDGTTVSITAAIAKLRQVRFGFSKINKGKFVDAASLISLNKSYIIDETISYINTTYPTFENPSETKCRRDIGYFIDAVTYHLNYGGNNRIVDYAEKYYVANQLNYIGNEIVETTAAFQHVIDLVKILIDPNNPNYGLYTFATLSYTLAPDEENLLNLCADVKSALDSYVESYNFIIENGPNLIQRDFTNQQRSGQYTDILTYSNYDIIDDTELQLSVEIDNVVFGYECANVISALYTLHQSLDTILSTGSGSVDISLPDYINGENTIFELYTGNNEILKTAPLENLLVFINGILQKPSAYQILRDEDPNVTDKIKFSSPPNWDVSDAQLNLGEGLSIDRFHAYSIGQYDRGSVSNNLIPYRRDLAIRDSTGGKIDVITDDRYFTVFVDGVQQKNRVDYNIIGNKIIFNRKLNSYIAPDGKATFSDVDIISYKGSSDNNNFRVFEFERGVYTSRATLDIYFSEDGGNFYDTISEWDGASKSYPLWLYNDGNPIGAVADYYPIYEPYDGVRLILSVDNNPLVNQQEPLVFRKNLANVPDLELNLAVIFDENQTFLGPEVYVYGDMLVLDGVEVIVNNTASLISAELLFNFNVNENDQRIFERISPGWMFEQPLVKNKAYRTTNRITSNLLEGDKIKIDGEKNYRTIVKVPDVVRSNNFVPFRPNDIYGTVITTPSLEIPGGSGLNITTIIDPITGAVTGLDFDQPNSIQLQLLGLTIPTLGVGYEPGVYIDFIPVDNNGGGAQARVFTWRGNVVSVELVRGGSGYTQPPIAVVTRGYDIIKSHRNIQPNILRTLNINLETRATINSQEITLINPNVSESGSFLPIGLGNPIDEFIINKFIESEIVGDNLQFSLTAIPQEIVIGGESFVSDVDVAMGDLPLETLFIKPQESSAIVGATTTTAASLLILSESRVGAGDTLITPEALNQIGTVVNINFNIGDTTLFVTSTDQFPDEGILIIGTEVMTYSSKLPDRFFIDIRGAEGTTEADHVVGDIVKIYLNFINSNASPTENIESDNIFDQEDGAPVVPTPAGPLNVIIDVEYEIENNDSPEILEPAAVFVDENNIYRAVEKYEFVEIVSVEEEITKITRNDQVFNIDFIASSTDISLFLASDIAEVSIEDASSSAQLQLQSTSLVPPFIIEESSLTVIAEYDSIAVDIASFVSYSSFVEKPAIPSEEPIGQILSVALSTSVESVFTVTLETREENLPLSNVEMPFGEQPPSDLITIITSESDTNEIVGETFSEVITLVEEESLPEDVSYIFIGETTKLSSQVIIAPRDIEGIQDDLTRFIEIESRVQTLDTTEPNINSVSISNVEENTTEESEITDFVVPDDILVSVAAAQTVSESTIKVVPSTIFVGQSINRIQEIVKTPDAEYIGVYPEIIVDEEITSVYDAPAHEVITPVESDVKVDISTELQRSAGDEFNENINPTQIGTN